MMSLLPEPDSDKRTLEDAAELAARHELTRNQTRSSFLAACTKWSDSLGKTMAELEKERAAIEQAGWTGPFHPTTTPHALTARARRPPLTHRPCAV